jgi:hypothetical protein
MNLPDRATWQGWAVSEQQLRLAHNGIVRASVYAFYNPRSRILNIFRLGDGLRDFSISGHTFA